MSTHNNPHTFSFPQIRTYYWSVRLIDRPLRFYTLPILSWITAFCCYVWLYTLLALLLSMTDIFSLYFNVIQCTATRGSRTYLTWMDLFHYCRPFISCNQAYLNWTRTIFCPSDSWTAAKPPQFLLVDFLHVFVTDGVSETTDTVSYWLHWILPRTTTAEL